MVSLFTNRTLITYLRICIPYSFHYGLLRAASHVVHVQTWVVSHHNENLPFLVCLPKKKMTPKFPLSPGSPFPFQSGVLVRMDVISYNYDYTYQTMSMWWAKTNKYQTTGFEYTQYSILYSSWIGPTTCMVSQDQQRKKESFFCFGILFCFVPYR
jgi:hypothetical protein